VTASLLRRAVVPLVRRLGAPVGSVLSVRTTAPQVVLTFDDGPEPGATDQVLAALAEHGATATFFVLLSKVQRSGGLLDEVVAAGHEIALHGVDHRRLTGFSPREVHDRTLAGRAQLEDRVQRPVRWFRPPYGAQTLSSWRAVRSAGLTTVLWGPTTWDWRDIPQDERVAKAQQGVAAGAVVLGHDGFPGPEDGVDDGPAPVLDRADLVRRVLTAYADRGLSGRSLGQVAATGQLVRVARFRR
jgi:peptidoglycan/xylan/chitin deacetylase (PgdA/CDA1 family)